MIALGGEKQRGRCRARLAATALAVLACGVAWGRPSFDESSLHRLLAGHGFSPAETRAVIATLDRAEAAGLSTSVLENRVREGLARHAQPGDIQRVLETRFGDLAAADGLAHRAGGRGIPVRDRQGSLTRLADSLAMGVAQEDVASLFPAAIGAKRDLDDVSRAAEVMGRLVHQGFPAADTHDVLGAALGAGWARGQMDGLVDVLGSARHLGVPPDRARRMLVDGIRAGKGLPRLSDEVKAAAKAAEATSVIAPPPPGASQSGRPDGTKGVSSPKKGVGSPHGPRTPSRGGPPRAPAPRPHMPRGPVHGPPHR
jgi:hypothetical protein